MSHQNPQWSEKYRRIVGLKLNFPVVLFQKEYKKDATGGRSLHWRELGQIWSHIIPSRARYPLVYEDQKHYRGAVYDMIVREDPLIYKADKIIWNHQDLFYLYSPQREEEGYLRVRLFAWEKNQ